VADVVPHHEGGRLVADRLATGRGRRRQAEAVAETGPDDDFPDMPHRALDRFQQRALDADGVIEAGRNLVRRVAVVDDVDAADEGQAAIHHGDLAVQAAQAMPSQAQVGQFRAVDEDLHAIGHQGRHQGPGKVPGAEAVGQDPHLEAAPGGPAEGGGDAWPVSSASKM